MLPTEKTPPKADASRKSFLLYGRSKVGKSTWASRIPGALFLVTDPGLDEIGCYRIPQAGVLKSWGEIRNTVEEIAQGGHQFKTIILDTVDIAFQLLSQSVCDHYRVSHWTDGVLGYGKGVSIIKNSFYRLILKLTQLPYGLILISHATERTYESRTGERRMVIPSLPEKAGEIVLGLVDGILFADVEPTGQRVIRLHNEPSHVAGLRGGKHLPATWALEDTAGFFQAYSESLQKNANENGVGIVPHQQATTPIQRSK